MTGYEIAKQAMGRITADPAVALPAGSQLHFESATIGHDFRQKAAWLQNWRSFRGVLLSLHFSDGGSQSVDGSAVLIAPGIALGARHVVEPRMEALMQGSVSAVCIGISEHGLQIWRVRYVTLVLNTDLVILGLIYASDLPPGNIFFQARVTTRLPKIGEKLMIAGFRATSDSFEVVDSEGLECSGQVLVCSGEVTNRFPQGRDRCVLPWPVLEIDCPTWGGMSGGPVFDSHGMLVGLLSSSLSTTDDLGPSYVSLLWVALGCRFEGGWPVEFFREDQCLLDLAPNYCAIDRPSAVSVSNTGSTTSIDYLSWE